MGVVDARRRAGADAGALMAAMVPVGMLLGPMLLPFAWFKDRVDPSGAVMGRRGRRFRLWRLVDSGWSDAVKITVPPPMQLDETTPAERKVLPIRATLEHLLSLYRQPRNEQPVGGPWELQVA